MKASDLSQHWHRIINTMTEGLILVDLKGSILMVNRSFEQLTGYSAEDVIGRSCNLIGCDACDSIITSDTGGWCKLFHPDQGDLRHRCTIIRKDGGLLPVIKNASVLKDEMGNVIGAVETITDLSEIDRLDHEVEVLARQLGDCSGYTGIVGTSPAMRRVFQLIEKAAHSDSPIIIFGESGTGKELVAEAIHERGLRKSGAFIKLNCAALNASLLESELFGHIKGAFTGAYRHRQGRFEAANGGDIFLDEIGDIPASVQVKLLRVLESKQVERVGDHRPINVDVRIISATNKNIADLISLKQFREDLFFRINVIPIQLPALHERKEDIPLLVQYFIQRLQRSTGKPISGLTRNAMQQFMNYSWPGNIRELKSALEYAFVIAESGQIDAEHLPLQIQSRATAVDLASPFSTPADSTEKTAVMEALMQANGNKSKAARILGVNRVTIWNRMKKYGIDIKKTLRT